MAAYALLITSFYSANQFLAWVVIAPDQPIRIDWSWCLGNLAVFCFFLHLRIFDDQKDYQLDCRQHPQRVLQRGLVTLGELKLFAFILIVLEVVCGLLLGRAALVAMAVCIGFSMLMWKEFFCGAWLRRHMLTYAASHMLVIPLLAWLVFSFSTARYLWQADRWFALYAAVGYLVAFNAEVSRKIRAPQEELPGVFSYTQLLGVSGTAWLLFWMRTVEICVLVLLGLHFRLAVIFYVLAALLVVYYVAALLRFWREPEPRSVSRLSQAAEIYMVIIDWAWIGGLALEYGVRFSQGAVHD